MKPSLKFPCLTLIIVGLAVLTAWPTAHAAPFYRTNGELDTLAREMDAWCSQPDGDSLVVSFFAYGHPWPPKAVRISLKERLFGPEDALTPPVNSQGTISWMRAEYDEQSQKFRKISGSRSLTKEEIGHIEDILNQSELFALPESKPLCITEDHIRVLRFNSLDPMEVIARAIRGEHITIVRRQTSDNIALDAVLAVLGPMEGMISQGKEAGNLPKPPLQTPVSGTPATGASVAPPSRAAGR